MHISYFADFILSGKSAADGKTLPESHFLCQTDGKETVIDAYCGTGTIGLIASSRAKHVIGVS